MKKTRLTCYIRGTEDEITSTRKEAGIYAESIGLRMVWLGAGIDGRGIFFYHMCFYPKTEEQELLLKLKYTDIMTERS